MFEYMEMRKYNIFYEIRNYLPVSLPSNIYNTTCGKEVNLTSGEYWYCTDANITLREKITNQTALPAIFAGFNVVQDLTRISAYSLLSY